VVICVAVISSIKRQSHAVPRTSTADRSYAICVPYSSAPAWLLPTHLIKKMSEVTPGLNISLNGAPDGDSSHQIEELDQLILRKPNGIVVCASDPHALVPTVNKAVSSGIPVVTIFNDVVGSKRLTFISAADRESARDLTQRILARMIKPQNGEPLEVLVCYNNPGMSVMEERLSGVKDVISTLSWVKIVGIVTNDTDDAKGAEAIGAALEKNPNIKLIIGIDSRAAIGALSALKERADRFPPGSVTVTGWDSDADVLQAIKEGKVACTCAPNINYMVQLAISILESYNLGYLYPDQFRLKEMGLPVLPDQINIQQTYIDGTNVDGYLKTK